jgi:hypothetical protein
VEEGLCIFFCFIVAQNHLCPVFFSLTKTSYLHLEKNYLELCTESVFLVGIGQYFLVFTIPIPKEKLVGTFWYRRYEKSMYLQ